MCEQPFHVKNHNISPYTKEKIEGNKVKSVPDWVRIAKVTDHCHITGKYRGAAHVLCNLNTRQTFSNYLPIAFHNLSIYDAQLFSTEVIKQKKTIKIDLNGETDEKDA